MSTSTAWNDFDALYDTSSKNKKTTKKRSIKKNAETSERKKKKTFQLRSLPMNSTVTEEELPEMLEAAPVPSKNNKEQLVAETQFFNKKIQISGSEMIYLTYDHMTFHTFVRYYKPRHKIPYLLKIPDTRNRHVPPSK